MNHLTDPIRTLIEEKYGLNTTIQPLQEEASTRRYFSILNRDHGSKYVLCLDQTINQDFILLSEFLIKNQIRVPRVIYQNEQLNITIQSWEGSKDFNSLSLKEYKDRLPTVLNLILKLQTLEPPSFVASRKFDTEKLMFEINLTIEKFLLMAKRFDLDTQLSNEASSFLEESARYLNQHPVNVFTHRDFHSRNLLLNDEGTFTLIDFQDARMGVPQYDLASIIYDAYYPLPRDFRKEMIDFFQKKTIGGDKKFKETFYLQALQRSFKALGTYFRMIVDQNNDKFKPSVITCLEQLEEIIQIGMFSDSLYIFIRSLRNEFARHPEFKSPSNL
jgi:aminoglycoside/choline kinase family phosphotransferase